MKIKKQIYTVVTISLCGLQTQNAYAYFNLTENESPQSFLLSQGNKCAHYQAFSSIKLNKCTPKGDEFFLRNQMLTYDNNKIKIGGWNNKIPEDKEFCLTNDQNILSFKTCSNELSSKQTIEIIPTSIEESKFQIKIADTCISNGKNIPNDLITAQCNNSDQDQMFTFKLNSDAIKFSFISETQGYYFGSAYSLGEDLETLNRTYIDEILHTEKRSIYLTDFRSYGLSNLRTRITTNNIQSQDIDARNVRSGDTIDVIVNHDGRFHYSKSASGNPWLYTKNNESFYFSSDQADLYYFSGTPKNIIIDYGSKWLLRVYENANYQGNSYLKYDTNYGVETRQNAASIRVIQTNNPNRSIIFKNRDDTLLENDFLVRRSIR